MTWLEIGKSEVKVKRENQNERRRMKKTQTTQTSQRVNLIKACTKTHQESDKQNEIEQRNGYRSGFWLMFVAIFK